MPIAYVEHPVTAEEKEKYLAEGFQIVDLIFKPEKLADGDKVFSKTKPKPKAKAKE